MALWHPAKLGENFLYRVLTVPPLPATQAQRPHSQTNGGARWAKKRRLTHSKQQTGTHKRPAKGHSLWTPCRIMRQLFI